MTARTPGARSRHARVDLAHPRPGEWAAEHGRVQHPRQLDVGGVAGLAARALEAVPARRRPADNVAWAGGPLLQRVLVDDDPLLGVAALDLLLGLDQPCHDAIASSILG